MGRRRVHAAQERGSTASGTEGSGWGRTGQSGRAPDGRHAGARANPTATHTPATTVLAGLGAGGRRAAPAACGSLPAPCDAGYPPRRAPAACSGMRRTEQRPGPARMHSRAAADAGAQHKHRTRACDRAAVCSGCGGANSPRLIPAPHLRPPRSPAHAWATHPGAEALQPPTSTWGGSPLPFPLSR